MKIALKLKTRQELADEYGIHRRTFYRWLMRDGIILKRGLVKSRDLELIYSAYGLPRKIGEEESRTAS